MQVPEVGSLVRTEDCIFFVGLRTRRIKDGEIRQIYLWNGEDQSSAKSWELSECQPISQADLFRLGTFKFSINQSIFSGKVATIDNDRYIVLWMDEEHASQVIKLPGEETVLNDAVSSFAQAFDGVVVRGNDEQLLPQWQ